MIEDLIEVRAAEESDLNFVIHSWLRSLRSYEPFYHSMVSGTYYKEHRKLINKALDRGHCLVVTPRNQPQILASYIVWENQAQDTIVHYIYTKNEYRKMGIGSLLMDTIQTGRNMIASARGVAFKKIPYNPYLLDGK